MSELFKIFLTSSLTVLGGILIFAVGQIIAKFFIEPMHEQFRLVGEIADSLIFYAYLYGNPGMGEPKKMDDASEMLRRQASQLMARTHAIRCYKLWQFLRVVPIKYADVIEASKGLTELSNSIHQGNQQRNRDVRREIETRLHIKTNI